MFADETYEVFVEDCMRQYVNDELSEELTTLFRTQLPDIFATFKEAKMYKWMMGWKEQYLKGELDPEVLEAFTKESAPDGTKDMVRAWETERLEKLGDQNPVQK